MISVATGSMALVMVALVAEHGLEFLLAATVLTGLLQLALGVLKVGRFITFVPHSEVLGFINSLAILIFLAQVPFLVGVPWTVYALVGLTIAIVHFLPRLTKTVPSSLVASLVVTALAIGLRLDIQSVGDLGTIARSLPAFALPAVPLSFETLLIILPYSATLMVVGLLESLLTASIVEEMTGTRSDRDREVRGQGLANCLAGLFGGMAGSRLSWPGSF